MMTVKNPLSIFFFIILSTYGQDWNYFNQDQWPGECNKGDWQSPINIETSNVECSPYDTFALSLSDTQDLSFTYQNNRWLSTGFSEFGSFVGDDVNDVVQSYVGYSASLHSFSEHTINFLNSDLELQLLFTLSDKSPGRTERTMAGISILFQQAESNNSGFLQAVDMLYLGQLENGTTTLNIKMNQLIGRVLIDQQNYTVYPGSLTTPNCEEIVNWYVINQPILITDDELDYFNQKYGNNSEGIPITANARSIQPLVERPRKTFCGVTTRMESLLENPAFFFLIGWTITGYLFWKYYGAIKIDDSAVIKEDIWTMHPLISIIAIPDKASFSRQCRIELFYVTIITQMITECICFRIEGYYVDINLLIFALLGILVSIPVTYVVGFLFRTYSHKINEMQRLMHFDSRPLSKYKSMFRLATFSIIFGGLAFLFYQVAYLVGILAMEWIKSVLIGVILDIGVFDWVVIYLSTKNEKLASMFKLRGYYYDGDISFYNILG